MTKQREIDTACDILSGVFLYAEQGCHPLRERFDAYVEGRLTRDQIALVADLIEMAFEAGEDHQIRALSLVPQSVKLEAVREALEAVQAWDDTVNPASYGGLPDRIRIVVDAALATPPLDNTGLDAATEVLGDGKMRAPPPDAPMSEVERQTAIALATGQLKTALAALATPSTDTGLDPATVERCALVADEELENRRAEQKRDLFCNYLRGQINAAIRIGDQIRALASGDRS